MEIVSIIIPTWNRRTTIGRAIDSALRQTYSSMEILICDDGSTDNTRDIAQRFMKVDRRIKWVPGAHGGRPAVPRNRGIRQSGGEWLAFLDSDDEWLPQKLEKQLALAKKLDLKAACSNAKRLLPDDGIVGNVLESKDVDSVITFDDLLKANQVICSSVLIHRSVFTAIGGFPERKKLKALEDHALWLRISTQTDFAYLAEPALVYRDDPKNSVRRDPVNTWTQRRRVYKDFLQWAKKQQQHQSDHNCFRTKARRSYLKSFMEQTWTSAMELRKLVRQV